MVATIARSKAARQLSLYSETEEPPVVVKTDTTSTLAGNVSLPVHRWFRYSAGFSAVWAHALMEKEKAKVRKTVLDPFSGSGTTVLEAEQCGMEAMGVEAHPLVAHVGRAKPLWRHDAEAFKEFAHRILDRAMRRKPEGKAPPPLLAKCFPPDVLAKLYSLRAAWQEQNDESM